MFMFMMRGAMDGDKFLIHIMVDTAINAHSVISGVVNIITAASAIAAIIVNARVVIIGMNLFNSSSRDDCQGMEEDVYDFSRKKFLSPDHKSLESADAQNENINSNKIHRNLDGWGMHGIAEKGFHLGF